jgi:conjugal transfer pilus assembly protein TraU
MSADRTALPAGSMPHLTFRLPKLGHAFLATLLAVLLLTLPGFGTHPAAAEPSVDCPDAGLLGPALLDSICWDCVFPIRFGGAVIGDGDVPDGAADGAVCVCDDNRGIPHLGLTYGMWEPAGLFEIVRSPGCSPILGGTRIEATGDLLRGSRGGTLYDKGDRAFYHYHMW